jgi:hypothetical protein
LYNLTNLTVEERVAEIETLYDEISIAHRAQLAALGVHLPHLRKASEFTRNALVLVALYTEEQIPVTKSLLTSFVRLYYPGTNDVQQARHLANVMGWNILSGTRGDVCPDGSYLFVNLKERYSGFTPKRQGGALDAAIWTDIQKDFQNRCATCGSVEGAPNLRNRAAKTQLQKGHMDPSKPLDSSNCIPQCQECNRPARNYWVWDEKGRPYALADPQSIERSSEEVQRAVLEILRKKFG